MQTLWCHFMQTVIRFIGFCLEHEKSTMQNVCDEFGSKRLICRTQKWTYLVIISSRGILLLLSKSVATHSLSLDSIMTFFWRLSFVSWDFPEYTVSLKSKLTNSSGHKSGHTCTNPIMMFIPQQMCSRCLGQMIDFLFDFQLQRIAWELRKKN